MAHLTDVCPDERRPNAVAELHSNADDINPRPAGIVQDVLGKGDKGIPTGVSCSCRPDPDVVGVGAVVAHWDRCPEFEAARRAFWNPAMRKRFKGYEQVYMVEYGRLCQRERNKLARRVTDYRPALPRDADLEEFLAKAINKAVVTPDGASFVTVCGSRVESLPERTTHPVVPVLVYLGRQPAQTTRGHIAPAADGHLAIREVRGLYDVRPTTTPLDTVAAWMASDGVEIGQHREEVATDALRAGCVILFGYRGQPCAVVDHADEIALLRKRLDELERRAADHVHSFDFTPSSGD